MCVEADVELQGNP